MHSTDLNLDAIQAKTAELRERLDRKNPWPSDNESYWTTEGWKNGTRNALDKLHVEALVAEVRRLRAELATSREKAADMVIAWSGQQIGVHVPTVDAIADMLRAPAVQSRP